MKFAALSLGFFAAAASALTVPSSATCRRLLPERNTIAAEVSDPIAFCQFYLSGPRIRTPFTSIPKFPTLQRACACVLKAENIALPRRNRNTPDYGVGELNTCEMEYVPTIQDQVTHSFRFCDFFNIFPRPNSPIPGMSAKQMAAGCKCIIHPAKTISTVSSAAASTAAASSAAALSTTGSITSNQNPVTQSNFNFGGQTLAPGPTSTITSVTTVGDPALLSTVSSLLSSLLPAINPTNVAGGLVPSIVTSVIDPLVTSVVAPIVTSVIDPLVTSVVGPIVSGVVNPALADVPPAVTGAVNSILSSMINPLVSSILSPVTSNVNPILSSVFPEITSAVAPLVTGVVNPIVSNALVTATGDANAVLSSIIPEVTNIVKPVLSTALPPIVTAIVGPVALGLNPLASAVVNPVASVVGGGLI